MNRKINLAQLTELFAKSSGLPKNVSALFVRNFFETIAKKVIDEDQVKVKGLGRSSVPILAIGRVSMLIPARDL